MDQVDQYSEIKVKSHFRLQVKGWEAMPVTDLVVCLFEGNGGWYELIYLGNLSIIFECGCLVRHPWWV